MTHIEELKAKIAELQATIEAMEAEAAKSKKFEWEYPVNTRYVISEHKIFTNLNGDDKDYLEHGRYRLTKEAAERSLARNKRANRLEALAEQLGGLKDHKPGAYSHYVYINSVNNWEYDWTQLIRPETVYMTKECAIEICRMLNEGEFSLEGEL